MPARGARRDEHRAGAHARAPPAGAAARRWPATRRSARARSRTSRPCRSSRHRDRRPSRRGCAESSARGRRDEPHRLLMAVPVQQDRAGPRLERQGRPPGASSPPELLEQHARRWRPPAASSRSVAAQQSGASSRTADRQLGSTEHDRRPADARGIERRRCCARPVAARRRADPARSAAGRSSRSAPAPAPMPARCEHLERARGRSRDRSSW